MQSVKGRISPELGSHIAIHATADALQCALDVIRKMAKSSGEPIVVHTANHVEGLIAALFESTHARKRAEDVPAPKTTRSAQ